MPKADAAKTKSAPKQADETPASRFLIARGGGVNPPDPAALPWVARHKRTLLYSLGIAIAVFAVLAPTLFYQPPTTTLSAGGKQLSLEIASTDAARERGLGGRQSLATNKGMIFVFRAPAKRCFWMKSMHFPLDMIFVGHDKRVVRIEQNISPQTYPNDFCAMGTQYVIELNAGTARQLGIHPGQTLKFS